MRRKKYLASSTVQEVFGRFAKPDYSKDGGARDDAILKSTISELHKLITEAPQFWSYELTIWAINTLANIGNILGPDRFTNHRLDSKNLDYPK